MEQKKYRVSVLMPCLNEEKTVALCVEKAKGFLNRNKIDGEVLVIDNASSDTSAERAKLAGARVVRAEEQGYGVALRKGIFEASGEYILMLDCDASYDVYEGTEFLNKLEEGYDLVIGNRFKEEMEAGAMPWLHRYIGNPALSWLGRHWSGTDVRDFHCGMRAFRKDAVEKLGLKTTKMEFASEMIMKAANEGLQLTEVPCKLYRDGRDGKSHLRTVRDGFRHLICMWSIRKRRERA